MLDMEDWHYIENYMDGRIEIYNDKENAISAMHEKPHNGEAWSVPQPFKVEKDD